MTADDLTERLARIIDAEAFSEHALTWTPGLGDFPSNWQHRRDAAHRKAREIAAEVAAAEQRGRDDVTANIRARAAQAKDWPVQSPQAVADLILEVLD